MIKRGVSQAVGWVLLVGLSISLAIFVGVWIKEQSQRSITGVADNLEKDTKCDDVLLSVIPNCKNGNICLWQDPDCVNVLGCGLLVKEDCELLSDICKWNNENGVCEDDSGCSEYSGKEFLCKKAYVYIESLNLTNKGLFSIAKIQCNGKLVELASKLDPDEERKLLNNCNKAVSMVVIPFVQLSDGSFFGCSEKKARGVC